MAVHLAVAGDVFDGVLFFMLSFFVLEMSSVRFVKTTIFYKRGDLDFDIVNFLFLEGNVPRSTSYGCLCFSTLMFRFARVSSHVDDVNTRNKVLTAKLLRQGYRYQ